jgi:2-C-methyl-D-erythritol 2,4-cyclodiphosphate synthase
MLRIGHGFDVHAFSENRRLILGGVDVPHTHGLLGHSDADVVIHALCDALLGALALGDLGQHFPDSDAHYKGADSRELLKKVYELVQEKGYHLNNADITIVAQAPKLAPYILSMRENIATDLKAEVGVISIKATTTEHLGYIGRKEGMAAYAVVTLINGK